MLEQTQIHQLMRDHYELAPYSVESLQTHTIPWRDLVQVTTATQTYLLRLLRLPDSYSAMQQTAQILCWLHEHEYWAPRIFQTVAGDFVLQYEDWTALLLSFIPGTQILPTETSLYQLGAVLGQLHALDVHNADTTTLTRSRCHPSEVATTYEQLSHSMRFISPTFEKMRAESREAVRMLLDTPADIRMTHGDCWFANAVHTPDDSVVLIDWDCAGLGVPLLDLGYLLLTSHFDLRQPLQVRPSQTSIAAILDGYCTANAVPPINFVQLQSAIRFLPAYQLGQHLVTNEGLTGDDPILQKLQARFAATAAIAEFAYDHLQRSTKG